MISRGRWRTPHPGGVRGPRLATNSATRWRHFPPPGGAPCWGLMWQVGKVGKVGKAAKDGQRRPHLAAVLSREGALRPSSNVRRGVSRSLVSGNATAGGDRKQPRLTGSFPQLT